MNQSTTKLSKRIISVIIAILLAVESPLPFLSGNIPVMADTVSKNQVTLLDSAYVNLADSDTEIVYNSSKHGLYIIAESKYYHDNDMDYTVTFYDIARDTYTQVGTFEETAGYYIANGKIYFLEVKRNRMETPVVSDGITYNYQCHYQIDSLDMGNGATASFTTDPRYSEYYFANDISTFGIDGLGRVYSVIGGEKLVLYGATGAYISEQSVEGGIVYLMDSHQYDVNDYTEQTTSIRLIDSGVDVSSLNISNADVVKMAALSADSVYEDNLDVSSVGPRVALSTDEKSLIVKSDTNLLTEYDIATQMKSIDCHTTYPVYDFFMNENQCIVLEKEGEQAYLEVIDWNWPTDFRVDYNAQMTVGSSELITCATDGGFMLEYEFSSSDKKVVSVDAKGKMTAWKAGTAIITIRSKNPDISKQIAVVVSDSTLSASSTSYIMKQSDGAISGNMHYPRHGGYAGDVYNSYMVALDNGNYQRVENLGTQVVVETYDSSFKRLQSKNIDCELKKFGGFFAGKNYNFLVFGQNNTGESNSKEVMRVVKYDKNWNRLGACSVKGANTYQIFEAGSLSMAETDDLLYIHTCHTMYVSDDGYHHQANMTFVVRQSDMHMTDSYYDVMNLSSGYVSHSFMQFIRTDEENIYRVDLGDAFPRGVAMTVTEKGSAIDEPYMYGSLFDIDGDIGQNYTGYSLSGFELTEDAFVVAGTGVKQIKDDVRNIYVYAGTKDDLSSKLQWITTYKQTSKIEVQSPKLVKLSANQLLLMWEERNTKKDTYITKMVLLGADGTKIGDVCQTNLALSECQPVVDSQGMVCWYVTNDSAPVFIKINPYKLSELQSATSGITKFAKDKTEDYTIVSVGSFFTVKNMRYKVTSTNEVTLIKNYHTAVKKCTIPKSVRYQQKTYKVTAVGTGAFKNNKQLKKVTVGANVQKIGAKVFRGCARLKTMKIKSKVLKTVGKQALYKTAKKVVIHVPKGKKKAYAKLFRGKGNRKVKVRG